MVKMEIHIVHRRKEGGGMGCPRVVQGGGEQGICGACGGSGCHLWVRPAGIWMACQNPAAAGAPAQRQTHQRGWPVGTWGWRQGWTAGSLLGWWLLSRPPCAAPSWGHCALWSPAVAPPAIKQTCIKSCQQVLVTGMQVCVIVESELQRVMNMQL